MAENIKGGRFFRSKQFERWLNRRLPPANRIELGQGNIFILPTREGAYVMILVFLMVLGGINYQNSLIFVLAFLLASLFMVGILHTFRNLSGLIIEAGSARPAFAGEDAPTPSARCMSTTSSQRPCLKPTSLSVPTCSKPAALCR